MLIRLLCAFMREGDREENNGSFLMGLLKWITQMTRLQMDIV